MNTLSLLVLAGGRSAEHHVSLVSAWNLCNKLKDSDLFELQLITIDLDGNWFLQDIDTYLKQESHTTKIDIGSREIEVLVKPGNSSNKLYLPNTASYLDHIDVVFPLLHGPNGEDGSMQGLLRHAQLPYVGPKVLGSAVCMDKQIAKQIMQNAGIPTSAFVTIHKDEPKSFEEVKEIVGLPMFVKPANMGSSVGISKVRSREEYEPAIAEAMKYDHKVIVEEFVDGIEVECAVLGNDHQLQVSVPGTYVHSDDFFDYDTKYLKDGEVIMQIPAASLTEEEQKEVMDLSLKAYQALCCAGLARVDTFFTTDRRFLVNEINTLPGFTQHSMYPILMEQMGVPYEQLVYQLCELAIASAE